MLKQASLWRKIQKNNFTDLETLCDFLNLSPHKRKLLLEAPSFPLNLPQRLANKIEKNTLEDPILLQFVPLKQELANSNNFVASPVADESFQKTPRLLKKYAGRALMMPTSACAMHCRFCFRKNYPYETSCSSYEKEFEALRSDASNFEVILSGGDPLSLSDRNLTDLIEKLSEIAHLKILRFHTRFPVGIPERISSEFLDTLASSRLQIVFVVHLNHAKELDNDVIASLKNIQKLGIPILTHSALLKGVNDNETTLYDLFLRISECGFTPYYLNQLDKVAGSAHFDVDIKQGKHLMAKLQERLPGYALPKYIQEVPYKKHKTVL